MSRARQNLAERSCPPLQRRQRCRSRRAHPHRHRRCSGRGRGRARTTMLQLQLVQVSHFNVLSEHSALRDVLRADTRSSLFLLPYPPCPPSSTCLPRTLSTSSMMRRPQSASSAYAPPMSASPRPTSPVSSSAPAARSNRVSSIQQQDSESVRRQSRLPELLTRKRTASMPHRKDRDGQPGEYTRFLPTPHLYSPVLPHHLGLCKTAMSLVRLHIPWNTNTDLGDGHITHIVPPQGILCMAVKVSSLNGRTVLVRRLPLPRLPSTFKVPSTGMPVIRALRYAVSAGKTPLLIVWSAPIHRPQSPSSILGRSACCLTVKAPVSKYNPRHSSRLKLGPVRLYAEPHISGGRKTAPLTSALLRKY